MDKTREAVMRSIVKNVGEARQVKDAMAANDAMLLEITLDLGAWEAVRTRYLELCPDVEERVTVSGFFGLVNDLRELVAFRRTAALGPTDLTVVAALERRLRVAAHDLSLEGGVAVNEFGGRIHKEILGLVE